MVAMALLDHVWPALRRRRLHASTLGIYFASMSGEHRRRNGLAGYALLDRYARDLPGVEQLVVLPCNPRVLLSERPALEVVHQADGRRVLADPRLQLPGGRPLHQTTCTTLASWRSSTTPRGSDSSAASRRWAGPSRPMASGSRWSGSCPTSPSAPGPLCRHLGAAHHGQNDSYTREFVGDFIAVLLPAAPRTRAVRRSSGPA